jgi:hypothetical protein
VLSEDVLLALLAVRAAASCVPGVSCWRQD